MTQTGKFVLHFYCLNRGGHGLRGGRGFCLLYRKLYEDKK